jgi:hypothetical protein
LHKLSPDRSLQYGLFLAALAALVVLSPCLLVNALSYLNLQPSLVRALSRGWLVWLLILDVQALILTAQPNTVGLVQVYTLEVAVGLLLLTAFRLPYSYAMLTVVFPGPAVLYFLVLGQIRGGKAKLD